MVRRYWTPSQMRTIPRLFLLVFVTTIFAGSAAAGEQSNARGQEHAATGKDVGEQSAEQRREELRSSEAFRLARKLWKKFKPLHLMRRDPVKVGHEQEIFINEQKTILLRTAAINPPIFEIENFLDKDECDYLIDLAKNNTWEDSRLLADGLLIEFSLELICSKDFYNFTQWDTNQDGLIDGSEGSIAISAGSDILITAPVFNYIITNSWWDFDRDGYLSRYEFEHANGTRLNATIQYLKRVAPQVKIRHSRQTWLPLQTKDAVLEKLLQRVVAATGLPDEIIRMSEPMQVVKYDPQGHYNCHHDSDDITMETPCCHNINESKANGFNCRVCRYATILYFLNDVEDGGETAFPLADKEAVDDMELVTGKEQLCNLERSCRKAGVVVKPARGKAVMWYNHKIDADSNWSGGMDTKARHGGCHVVSGEKWVANNWINVGPNKMRDIVAYAKMQASHVENAARAS